MAGGSVSFRQLPRRSLLGLLGLVAVSGTIMGWTADALGQPALTVGLHLIVVGALVYGLSFTTALLLAVLPQRWVATALTLTWALFTYVLLWTHVLFYVSMSNWGLPLNLSLLLSQVREVPYLVRALPVPVWLLAVAVLVPLLLCGGYARWLVHGMRTQLAVGDRFRPARPSWLWYAAFLLPVLIGAVAWLVRPDRILTDRGISPKQEPVLALFFRSNVQHNHQIRSLGMQHRRAAEAYPLDPDGTGPNVIFLMCDALRADHLGLYGYGRPTSPKIDSLFGGPNALVDRRMFAVSGVSFNGISAALASRAEVTSHNFPLHEVLAKRGYETEFVISGDFTNFYNLRDYLFRHHDRYQDGASYQEAPYAGPSSLNDDRILVLEKLRRLPARPTKPQFLYLHFMSTHQVGRVAETFKVYKDGDGDFSSRRRRVLTNAYDNGVTQLDAYVAEALQILEQKGYLDDALVVLTADHGQSLAEDGHVWHGNTTNVSETYIPFLLRRMGAEGLPAAPPPPTLHDQTAIAPTVIDLLDLPVPASWEGRSVYADAGPKPVFQSEATDYATIRAVGDSLYQVTFSTKTKDFTWRSLADPARPRVIDGVEGAERWEQQVLVHFGLD